MIFTAKMKPKIEIPWSQEKFDKFDPICHNCIKQYQEKFPDEKSFKIKCKGIRREEDLVPKELEAKCSPEQLEMLKATQSAPLWERRTSQLSQDLQNPLCIQL